MNTESLFVGYSGEVLKEEYMNYHGISNEEMAKKTGIEIETMNGIVNGTIPFTAELSKMIGKVVGVDEDFYLGLQESFDKRLDPLQQAIIKTGNPKTMNEYYRQSTILVAMSLLEIPKNNQRKAEFGPLYLQKITFLIDQEVSVDESSIFEHEMYLHGPNDYNVNITMDRLIQEGFVDMKLPKGQKAWVLKYGKRISIRNIVNMAMNMRVTRLMGYVYEKYPHMNPVSSIGGKA